MNPDRITERPAVRELRLFLEQQGEKRGREEGRGEGQRDSLLAVLPPPFTRDVEEHRSEERERAWLSRYAERETHLRPLVS